MKYRKGFSIPLMLIALGVLVGVTVIGLVIQTRIADKKVSEAAKQTATVAEPTSRVGLSPTQKVMTASDATDTKLDEDTSDINASIQAISVDAASIDAGLGDQMGDLSE